MPNATSKRTAVRTAAVVLDGNYEGWSATVRTNPPQSVWTDFVSGDDERFRHALAQVVLAWDFVDDDGNDVPLPSADDYDPNRLPFDLIPALVRAYTASLRAATEVPKD